MSDGGRRFWEQHTKMIGKVNDVLFEAIMAERDRCIGIVRAANISGWDKDVIVEKIQTGEEPT